MNRRQRTPVTLSVAALLSLSSLSACGFSPSASADSPPPSLGGNVREHHAHRGVAEGSSTSPEQVKSWEHLAHQDR